MKKLNIAISLIIAMSLCVPVIFAFQEVVPPTPVIMQNPALIHGSMEGHNSQAVSLGEKNNIVQADSTILGKTAGPTYKFIRKIGSYGNARGQFIYPWGVAVDGTGNIYVADMGNNRIQKFNSAGKFLKAWGKRGYFAGEFYNPSGITIDKKGYVYVADTNNGRVQKFTSNGKFMKSWDVLEPGWALYSEPTGIAAGNDGNIYVTDNANNRIFKFTSNGKFLKKWGGKGSGDGKLSSPSGIAIDRSGYIYVADTDNHRIQKFTSSGVYVTQWGTKGSGKTQFAWAIGVATDKSGNVYVVDSDVSSGPDKRNINRVQKFTSKGKYLLSWGSTGTGNGKLIWPRDVAVDSSGKVYVVDFGNHRIQVFSKAGV